MCTNYSIGKGFWLLKQYKRDQACDPRFEITLQVDNNL